MSSTCELESVPGPKRGMLPGPVRTASQIIVLVTPCNGGAWIPSASASPAPVMVWQGAQLSANKLKPTATFACEMSRPSGIPGLPNDVSHDVENPAAVELCRLAFGLGGRLRQRHPPAGKPEVYRRATHSQKRWRPVASRGIDPMATRAILHKESAPGSQLTCRNRAVLARKARGVDRPPAA